jgi:RNA polymerase sigma-70 factor (ECF subfamily)
MKRRVREALDKLPEKFRLALILTAIEGHSLADVAEMLGVPEGTVKSRLHFGKKQLAGQLRWLADDTKKR